MKPEYRKWVVLGACGVVMGTTIMLLGYSLPGFFIWICAAIFLVAVFMKIASSPK